jgi:predicted ArsR family transcriptional regulator
MPKFQFPVQPDSLRQRVLQTVPYVGVKSAAAVCDELGLTERTQRIRACSTLQDLVEDGHLERVGMVPRAGRWGRPSRTYRRLTEPQTAIKRQFAQAKRIVEAAGFVLVPRRAP